MKIIYRYLLKDILHQFGLFLLIFLVIMLINETFDMRKEFVENQPSMIDILRFLAYSLPEQIAQILPLIGLLATMMAYGLQAKNREILAMIASGMSFKRLAIPAVLFGVTLTVACYWFNETVVPEATRQARFIEKVEIGGRSESMFTTRDNLFLKGQGNRFYYMQEYLPSEGRMVYPTVLEMSETGGEVRRRIEAVQATLITLPEGQRVWEMTETKIWNFSEDSIDFRHYEAPYRLAMEENLDKFLSRTKKPEEMNLPELTEYVGLVQDRGDENIDRYATRMHQKMAFPITALLMALLGFASVLDLHARRFTRGAFVGLVSAIGYYLVEATMVSIGEDGLISPAVAGWTGVVLFAALVAWMISRLERVH